MSPLKGRTGRNNAGLAARPPRPARWLLAGLLGCLAAGSACQCGGTTLTQTLPPGARIDTFEQAKVSKIDVLWVVDNSRSMIEEQQNLADNLVSFFHYLTEDQVDYQIGVTTTDDLNLPGQLMGSPKILDPSTPDVLADFKGNIQVGINGGAKEEGFAGAWDAIQQNKDLIRSDAYLFIIFVSDEDDQSFGELRYYWRVFEQLKGIGNEGKVTLSAIVGPPSDPNTGDPGGCVSPNGKAVPGDRYVALVKQTGGLWGSICDASFAKTLEALGAQAVGLRRKFFLSETADPKTIDVEVHYPCTGRPSQMGSCKSVKDTCSDPNPDNQDYVCTPPAGKPNGWVYEAQTNSIFFEGDSVPGLKATIEVIYKKPTAPVTH